MHFPAPPLSKQHAVSSGRDVISEQWQNKNHFFSLQFCFYFQSSPSLCLNTVKITVLPAHTLSVTRKPVKTVLGGPRKHTERFGCNSHIGQLNATTSALSLPFAYSIHMLMMSLVFFFFFCMCVCACVFVSAICFSLCVFFFLYFLPSSQSLCIAKQKEMQKIWIHTSLFGKKKKKRYSRPIFTSSRLKGRLDECHSCSIAVPLISTRSPFNSREGKALSLPQAA